MQTWEIILGMIFVILFLGRIVLGAWEIYLDLSRPIPYRRMEALLKHYLNMIEANVVVHETDFEARKIMFKAMTLLSEKEAEILGYKHMYKEPEDEQEKTR